MDAQIVLAWLLSTKANHKNIFVDNWLKAISLLKKERNSKLNVSVKLKYVPTDQNPADLITKGLTLNKYKLNLNFWIRRPTRLRDSPVSWPVNELKCFFDFPTSCMMGEYWNYFIVMGTSSWKGLLWLSLP